MDIDMPRENNTTPSPPRTSDQVMEYCDIEMSIVQPDCPQPDRLKTDTDIDTNMNMIGDPLATRSTGNPSHHPDNSQKNQTHQNPDTP